MACMFDTINQPAFNPCLYSIPIFSVTVNVSLTCLPSILRGILSLSDVCHKMLTTQPKLLKVRCWSIPSVVWPNHPNFQVAPQNVPKATQPNPRMPYLAHETHQWQSKPRVGIICKAKNVGFKGASGSLSLSIFVGGRVNLPSNVIGTWCSTLHHPRRKLTTLPLGQSWATSWPTTPRPIKIS